MCYFHDIKLTIKAKIVMKYNEILKLTNLVLAVVFYLY